jgi:hypothetical protein
MSNLPSIFKSPRGEAEHMVADEASSNRMVIDLSPRVRQVSFWAAVFSKGAKPCVFKTNK